MKREFLAWCLAVLGSRYSSAAPGKRHVTRFIGEMLNGQTVANPISSAHAHDDGYVCGLRDQLVQHLGTKFGEQRTIGY